VTASIDDTSASERGLRRADWKSDYRLRRTVRPIFYGQFGSGVTGGRQRQGAAHLDTANLAGDSWFCTLCQVTTTHSRYVPIPIPPIRKFSIFMQAGDPRKRHQFNVPRVAEPDQPKATDLVSTRSNFFDTSGGPEARRRGDRGRSHSVTIIERDIEGNVPLKFQ